MSRRLLTRTALGLAVILSATALAACGSSSKSSASASSQGASSTTTSGATGPGGGAFASLTSTQKSCLKSHGVTIPTGAGRGPGGRPTGGTGGTGTRPSGRPPTGGFGAGPGAGGTAGTATGTTNSKFATALKACGVTLSHTGPRAGAAGAQTKVSATALKEFQACVVKHGYDLRSINTSGTGPILPTSLRSNAKFTAAAKDCEQYLQPASS